MNGRWDLMVTPDGRAPGAASAPDAGAIRNGWSCVPVVPVDDAAVERAAEAVRLQGAADVGWHAESGTYALFFWDVDRLPERWVAVVVEGYSTPEAANADVPRLRAVAALRAAGEVE